MINEGKQNEEKTDRSGCDLVKSLMLAVPVVASDKEIVLNYTNDVHSYIDNATEHENRLTYSKVAALKDSTPGALLVDTHK